MTTRIADPRYHGPNRDKFKGRYKVCAKVLDEDAPVYESLADFAARIQSLLDSIPEQHRHTARVGFDTREDYDSHTATWEIEYHREETDEEVAARIVGAEAAEQARANARRDVYERLRKEFEGGAS